MPSPIVEADVVEDKKLMDFPDALREVIGGAMIKRTEWGELDEYIMCKDNHIMIHKGESGRFHQFVIHENDYNAIDWFVIKQTN